MTRSDCQRCVVPQREREGGRAGGGGGGGGERWGGGGRRQTDKVREREDS